MVSTLSNKPQALYDARVEYTQHAAQKIRENVPKHLYVYTGSLRAYAKQGPNEAQWVRSFCNLKVAKAGLESLIESADEELGAIRAQWHHEQHMLDHIGEQLDGFATLRTVPEACRLLYERIDLEAELTEASQNSGIKESHADLRSYREEKQECQDTLERLQSQLDALSNPPATSEKSRSKDKKSQRDTPPSRSELHKQKKALRLKIAAKQSDLATLDNMLAEARDKLDGQIAALAPQQLELATLIGTLVAAGVPPEEQKAITDLLRQLDDYTDRHDKTTSLLDHGNMAPFLQSTGEVVLSAGPHSAQQLTVLLKQVRKTLSYTKGVLDDELARYRLKDIKDGSEYRSERIAPQRAHYQQEQLLYSYAHTDLPGLLTSAREDAAALPGALRFSRVAASLPTPEQTITDPQAEPGKGKEVATSRPRSASPQSRMLHQSEQSSESEESEIEESEESGSDESDNDFDIRDEPDVGRVPSSLPALGPATSNALVPLADAVRPTGASSQALVPLARPVPRAAESIELPAPAVPGTLLPAADTAFFSNGSIMAGTRLALMAPPPALERMPEPVEVPASGTVVVRRNDNAKALSASASRTSSKTKPSVNPSRRTSSATQEKISKSSKAAPASAKASASSVPSPPPLLPEPNERRGAYHFGSADLDWDWQEMKVEFRVPAPLPQAPEDAIDLAAVRKDGRLLMISDTAYEEPEVAAPPAPLHSSSDGSAADTLQVQETPPARAAQTSSSYGFTARELHQQGRSATMPDHRSPAPDAAPLPRRATAPQTSDNKARASASADTAQPGQAPKAAPKAQPAPTAGPHEQPGPQAPIFYAVPVPVPVPTFVLPPDPRIPWCASAPFYSLPAAMRDELMLAAMRNEYCTTVWHPDMNNPVFGMLKLYYVVRDNIPATSAFPLSPAGTPNPIFYTVHPGNPFCHVMEILPLRSVNAPPPGFRQAPPPVSPTWMPSARMPSSRQPGGPFAHPSTDRRSPRFVDPDRVGIFDQEPAPEPVRRPRVWVDSPSFDDSHVEAPTEQSQGGSSRRPRCSHRYGREQAEASARTGTSGTSGRRKKQAPSPEEFWDEQARHRSHHSKRKRPRRDKHEKHDRPTRHDRPSGSRQPEPTFQEDMPLAQAEENDIIIDIAPLDMGVHAPVQVLGTTLPQEARARALKAELDRLAYERQPIPRHPERDVPLTDEQVNKEIDAMLNDPGELNKPEFKDAKPTLSRAEAIVNELRNKGFDLGRLNDLHVDLGYMWNNGEADTRRVELGKAFTISKVEPPPAFAAAFSALCDKLLENEVRINARLYDKMAPAERDAALAAKRAEFEGADKAPYMDYLRQRYARVFSFEMTNPMLKAMWTRVRHKLSAKINELAAAAVTDSATFQSYDQARRQRLQQHLALQKNGLSEDGIDKDPGFRKLFDERLEQKLRALSESEPDKMSTPEKRQAQRSNLSKALLGSEGLAMHEQYLLNSEFGTILRPVKQQLAANTWAAVMDRLATEMEAAK